MSFERYLNINNEFQNSINLYLDLDKKKKVESFIPTFSNVEFLQYFYENVENQNSMKTTMLIGPYGKGKSHAVLVLLNLLLNGSKEYPTLIEKIKNVDSSTANLIANSDKKLLPVIVNGSSEPIETILLGALVKSLKNAKITDIVFDTDYQQAINRIDDWKTNHPDMYLKLADTLKNKNITVRKLKIELKKFNREYYDIFSEVHKEILAGVPFESISYTNILDCYIQANHQLCDLHGYNGMFIVFDEFSKFLESRNTESITNDMKIIQDLTELANANGNPNHQINFMLIMHKAINDHIVTMPKVVKNAFRGIEGRTKEMHFNSTYRDSFELISSVLLKTNEFNEYLHDNNKVYDGIYQSCKRLAIFNDTTLSDILRTVLVEKCAPLLPGTSYLLLEISELVAQNERSIFTFLASKEKNSLIDIINRTGKEILTADIVYDYFSVLFQKEKDNARVRKTYYETENALKKLDDENQRKFIKILSLILMVNKSSEFVANAEYIAAAMNITLEQSIEVKNTLVSSNIIREKNSSELVIRRNTDVDIQNTIQNTKMTKIHNFDLCHCLNELDKNHYTYPYFYNAQNKITRFYKVYYMDDTQFLQLNDTKYFYEESFSDGIIIKIINRNNADSQSIEDKTHMLNDPRLVVAFSHREIKCEDVVKNIIAVEKILEDKQFLEASEINVEELEDMLEEYQKELYSELQNHFGIGNGCTFFNMNLDSFMYENEYSFNRHIGDVFQRCYDAMPIFNLELLNKNNPSGVYSKARKNVVDSILRGTVNDDFLGNNSPESTIILCCMKKTGLLTNDVTDVNLEAVIRMVTAFLREAADEPKSLGELYTILMNRPYGIRKGVIPIILSFSIKIIDAQFILLYKNHEMDLDATNIEMVNSNPIEYKILLDATNAEMMLYMDKLSRMYNISLNESYANRYRYILQNIVREFNALPKVTKEAINASDRYRDNIVYRNLKKTLMKPDLNPRETLMVTLPRIFDGTELRLVPANLRETFNDLNHYLDNCYSRVRGIINKSLGYEIQSSVVSSLTDWYLNKKQIITTNVYNGSDYAFTTEIENLIHMDEKSAINRIAKIYIGMFIEDWSESSFVMFEHMFGQTIENLSQTETESKNKLILQLTDGSRLEKAYDDNLDDDSDILLNIFEEAIDDYGDTMSNDDIIALCVKLMKKHM